MIRENIACKLQTVPNTVNTARQNFFQVSYMSLLNREMESANQQEAVADLLWERVDRIYRMDRIVEIEGHP